MNMDEEEFVVEEVETLDLSEAELDQFEEIKPLEIIGFVEEKEEAESVLIEKFMRGEGDLPDLYPKLEPQDELEEFQEIDDDNDKDQPEEKKDSTCTLPSEIAGYSNTENPTTQHFEITNLDLEDVDGEQVNAGSSINSRLQGGRRANRSGGSLGYTKRGVLNPGLKGLMGEANLCFAQNQKEKAEKICMEIIRQNPLAPEPFLTLAQIYENRDPNKYMGYHTIAAHLMPHNREQWIHVANLHIACGNLPKARLYFSKAIKVMPKCYDLRLRKVRLLELMGDVKSTMFAYLRMLPLVPAEHGEFCLKTAKDVTHYFHGLGKHQYALEAMDAAYNVCGELFTLEDLNLYLELLIINKKYEKVVRCLVEHTQVQIETERENQFNLIVCCFIPDELVPDLRAKLMVALVHLHTFHLIDYIVSNAHSHFPLEHESNLDLYVDVAEALMQEQRYAEAVTLLSPLTKGYLTLECPAFIWLRYAECFRYLNRYEEAIANYYRVVVLAPNCYEAKFTLSALLKQLGRHEEAVDALAQAIDGDNSFNARMLYERCIMLQELKRYEDFFDAGFSLLSRQSLQLRNREEMLAVANSGSSFQAEGIKIILEMRSIADYNDITRQDLTKPTETDLCLQDEYDLFLKLISVAFKHRKFSYIERLCFAMVTNKRFVTFQHSLARIMALACYFNKDGTIAFLYLRDQISRQPENVSFWNILSFLGKSAQDFRYHRFVRRLVKRQPFVKQSQLLVAHYHLYCTSYKYALVYYLPIYKERQDAMAALCIAVIFNQLSLQKKVLRKTGAVGQAISFAQIYAQRRCCSPSVNWEIADDTPTLPVHQEIYYNIGRIYQQASLNHLAVYYYEQALAVEHKLLKDYEQHLDLKQEIAFNLHLLYRASGNFALARHYLYTYCVI